MVDDCSNPFNGYYAQIGAGAGRETGSTVIYTDEFHTGDPTSFYLSGGNEGSLVSSIDGSTFAITSSFNGGQWVRYSNPTTNYGSFATDSGSLTCSISDDSLACQNTANSFDNVLATCVETGNVFGMAIGVATGSASNMDSFFSSEVCFPVANWKVVSTCSSTTLGGRFRRTKMV